MRALTLKDYKGIRTPFVFFDETGSLNDEINRFFCLGMVKCMQPFYLDSRIREIRQKYQFYDEIKWNTLSKAKINVIKEIIEAVFETPGIHFSCIVINKDNIKFEEDFVGGVSTKRFKVFEYNHTLEGTKKGPSS